MTTKGGLARTTFELLLATLVMIWPALVNRQPFLMSDTTTYIRAADAAAYKLTGHTTEWTDQLFQRFPKQVLERRVRSAPETPGTEKTIPRQDEVVLLGRSIYYGAFLYIADRTVSLWGAVLAQALLVVIAMRLTLARIWSTEGTWQGGVPFLLLAAGLAVATPVAFFACFLMPDIFTGLAILAVANLGAAGRTMEKVELVFWSLLVALGALFHSANILILGATVAFLIAGCVVTPALRRSATLLPIVAAVAAGFIGELLFSTAVTGVTGFSPVRPPFISARLIADGPGKEYLDERCPGAGFLLCRFAQRMPKPSDTILWSHDPKDGVFSTVAGEDKRRLAEEDRLFALAVLRDRPAAVVESSLRAVADQALKFRLGEFNYPVEAVAALNGKLPSEVRSPFEASAAAQRRMPTGATEILTALTLMFALMVGILLFLGSIGAQRVRTIFAVILIGTAANIFVCGALSTPHDRYSARVLWVIVLVAAAVVWPAVSKKRARSNVHEYA